MDCFPKKIYLKGGLERTGKKKNKNGSKKKEGEGRN